MGKTLKRATKRVSDWDRKIGLRVAYLRRCQNMRQSELAMRLGLTRAQLSTIEAGRVALRLQTGWKVCKALDVHPSFLLTGHWPQGGEMPFPPSEDPRTERLDRIIAGNRDSVFSEGFPDLLFILRMDVPKVPEGEKEDQGLTTSSDSVILSRMKSELEELVEIARRLTKPRGMKTKLAQALRVPLPRVSDWLAGNYLPSGQRALELREWVRAQEGQQKQSPDSASTPSGQKTQSQESNEKKPRSNPPEG